jgi:hypothetical protein
VEPRQSGNIQIPMGNLRRRTDEIPLKGADYSSLAWTPQVCDMFD